MASPWPPYGLPMTSSWPPYGLPMTSPWPPHDLSMTSHGLPMTSLWSPHGSTSALLLQSPWVLLLSQLPHRSCPMSSLVPLNVGAGIPIVHVSPFPTLPSPPCKDAFPQPLLVVPGSSLSWPSASAFQRPSYMASFLRKTASLRSTSASWDPGKPLRGQSAMARPPRPTAQIAIPAPPEL